jgi:hypothetical protein
MLGGRTLCPVHICHIPWEIQRLKSGKEASGTVVKQFKTVIKLGCYGFFSRIQNIWSHKCARILNCEEVVKYLEWTLPAASRALTIICLTTSGTCFWALLQLLQQYSISSFPMQIVAKFIALYISWANLTYFHLTVLSSLSQRTQERKTAVFYVAYLKSNISLTASNPAIPDETQNFYN